MRFCRWLLQPGWPFLLAAGGAGAFLAGVAVEVVWLLVGTGSSLESYVHPGWSVLPGGAVLGGAPLAALAHWWPEKRGEGRS